MSCPFNVDKNYNNYYNIVAMTVIVWSCCWHASITLAIRSKLPCICQVANAQYNFYMDAYFCAILRKHDHISSKYASIKINSYTHHALELTHEAQCSLHRSFGHQLCGTIRSEGLAEAKSHSNNNYVCSFPQN